MLYAHLSDESLIELYLNQKDVQALECLINRYRSQVFGYILKLKKNREIAEDLFQDTFVKVINSLLLGKYNENGKFLSWVLRIAHNLVIDSTRAAKRINFIDSPKEDFDAFKYVNATEKSVESDIMYQQQSEQVAQLVNYLSEEQREVVVMRMYLNLSFNEIADILNISINTALGRMRYALINLRNLIQEKQLTF